MSETGPTHTVRRDGNLAEQNARKWLLMGLLIVGPFVALAICYQRLFHGLAPGDALDFAQIARNLESGRGFSTFILRPLAVHPGLDVMHQPDVTHGPLYSIFLAIAFGIFGTSDGAVAGVSSFFYIATIPLVYLLGQRMFSQKVGVIGAVVFTYTPMVLGYAISGLPVTCYTFVMSALLLSTLRLAEQPRDSREFPTGFLAASGALAGLAWLCDPVLIFAALAVVICTLSWYRAQMLKAIVTLAVPFFLVAGWWMIRNLVLTGNPIFGLRAAEIWMNTGMYPGFTAYRLAPDELLPGGPIYMGILRKLVTGSIQGVRDFPGVATSQILVFLIPSLLFKFQQIAASRLRVAAAAAFVALFVAEPILAAPSVLYPTLFPILLVLSTAFMIHLVQTARLDWLGRYAAAALLGATMVCPLAWELVSAPQVAAVEEADAARTVAHYTRPDEAVLSDQPWITAWYSNRPSLWIPDTDNTLHADMARFPAARWLFLTPAIRNYAGDWTRIYEVFLGWSATYQQAVNTGKRPPAPFAIKRSGTSVLAALNGFSPVALPNHTPITVVVATSRTERVSASFSHNLTSAQVSTAP